MHRCGKTYVDKFKSPVFVACPDPPFKASFFRANGVNETSGAVKYFWIHPKYKNLLKNNTSIAMDIFMNMTYQLGSEWQIYLGDMNGQVLNINTANPFPVMNTNIPRSIQQSH